MDGDFPTATGARRQVARRTRQVILAVGLLAAAAAIATMSARSRTPLAAPAQAAPPPTTSMHSIPAPGAIDIGAPAWFDPDDPSRTEPPEE
jgi:hypothetical protein